jgi:hypothetical protein
MAPAQCRYASSVARNYSRAFEIVTCCSSCEVFPHESCRAGSRAVKAAKRLFSLAKMSGRPVAWCRCSRMWFRSSHRTTENSGPSRDTSSSKRGQDSILPSLSVLVAVEERTTYAGRSFSSRVRSTVHLRCSSLYLLTCCASLPACGVQLAIGVEKCNSKVCFTIPQRPLRRSNRS